MITNYITNNYNTPCEYNTGGINKLFISSWENVQPDRINIKFNEIGNISELDFSFIKLDINVDEVSVNSNYDPSNRKYNNTMTLRFNNMSDSWKTVKQFENHRYVIGYRDMLGTYWVGGLDTGFRLDPSESTFGAKNQVNGWVLVLRESSRRPIYKINQEIIDPIITDDVLPLQDWPLGFFSSDKSQF